MRRQIIWCALGAALGIPAQAALTGEVGLALRPALRLHEKAAPRRVAGRVALPGLRLTLASALAYLRPVMPPEPAPRPVPVAVPFELFERARVWQSRARDDLAAQALAKLFRIDPDHADGIALLAQLQLRAGQKDALALTLARLQRVQPTHPGLARIATMQRLQGPDSAKLRQMRQLARSGRSDEALAAFRALTPDGVPDGELGLEYWEIVGATKQGWQPAQAGLSKLVQDDPENLRYRLALAQHVTSRKPVDRAALATIIALTEMGAYAKPARIAWRGALLRLDPVESSLPLLRQYVEQEPTDSAVRERLASFVVQIEERRKMLADPHYRARLEALALLDGGKLDMAERKLDLALAGRTRDADAVGALGLIDLRRGRHAQAHAHFLEAAHMAPAQREKWQSLANTASYWGLLREAGDAVDGAKFDLALEKLEQARRTDPKEPNAVLAQAKIYTQQKRRTEAEQAYRLAFTLAPDNSAAARGLMTLYLGSGQEAAAAGLEARLSPQLRAQLQDDINRQRGALLRTEADAMHAAGRSDQARAILERAVKTDRNDPWLRYDLARLYGAGGAFDKGQALFDDLLLRHPDDPVALYALAQFQSGQSQASKALLTLEQIAPARRSEKMAALQHRLWLSVQSERALALFKNGQTGGAQEALAGAEAGLGADRDIAFDVADAMLVLGQRDPARALLARFGSVTPAPSMAWQMHYARWLNRIDADADLAALLPRLASEADLTPSDRATLAELHFALTLRSADALRQQGQFDAALKLLQHEALATSNPERKRLLFAQARLERALLRWDAAQQRYRAILVLDPDSVEARLALLDSSIAAGRQKEAWPMADALLASSSTFEFSDSKALLGSLIDLGDFSGARQLVETLLPGAPHDARLLAYAGKLAQRDGRIEQALDYLQRALAEEMMQIPVAPELSRLAQEAAPEGEGTPRLIAIAPSVAAPASSANYGNMADLLDQRSAWFSASFERRGRSGTPGVSQLDTKESTLEWKQGQKEGRRLFLRADVAVLDAGPLAPENSNYGTLMGPRVGGAGLIQAARGVGFDVGFESPGLRADIGTTPLCFPVTNLIGGILYKGDLGPLSYSIDAARRPLTGSVLSYAGARDPLSDRVWGGVLATGVRLGLSKDEGGAFGAWSSFGAHQLSGKNVQDNARLQLMGGTYWRAINQQDLLLSVGVTAMHWRFSQNAGEYSFGHGGYYSPAVYSSLSLPLTFGQRGARFSYSVRAALSNSWSKGKEAAYFPTDAALQAASVDPRYGASTGGRSTGRSLAAMFEYQLNPKLFVGSRIELERSVDYAPNRFFLYLRFNADRSAARPAALPPEPLIPTAQF